MGRRRVREGRRERNRVLESVIYRETKRKERRERKEDEEMRKGTKGDKERDSGRK